LTAVSFVAKDVKGHCGFSTARRDTGYIARVKRKPRLGKKKALARSWVNRKFRPGFRGYPIATVAFYGPDDKLATKVVVSLFLTESNEPDFLRRWYSESDIDVRQDLDIGEQILGFLKPHAPPLSSLRGLSDARMKKVWTTQRARLARSVRIGPDAIALPMSVFSERASQSRHGPRF
jgi:hypothetical protein